MVENGQLTKAEREQVLAQVGEEHVSMICAKAVPVYQRFSKRECGRVTLFNYPHQFLSRSKAETSYSCACDVRACDVRACDVRACDVRVTWV